MSARRRMMWIGMAVLVGASGTAASTGAEDLLARASVEGAAISWQPVLDEYESLTLSVSGPDGSVFRMDFPAGESLFFSGFDTAGAHLPDGSYTFEIRVAERVSEQVSDAVRAARERGDLGAQQASAIPPGLARTQSGSFRVEHGRFIGGRGDAGSDRDGGARTLIPDDLYVHNSACVGFDCVNNEPFGSDTIRLKENNLRIHFDDTSVGSFPGNDWRLVVNDSVSGGANRFSIEDSTAARTPFTIAAGARSNALYVSSAGRIGIGTATPVVDTHIVNGNTPTLRLEQDGSSGFAPQTWDIAGNETNFFVRDVTHGSRLPLRIRPEAPTNSIFVDFDGDIGLGTASPDKNFDIEDSGPTFRLTNTGTAGGTWDFFVNGNTGRMNITDDGTNTRVPVKIDPGASNNLLRVGVVASGQVDIAGNLVVSGTITPDYVFEPDYELESIAEHAEFMWREKHLPEVAPAQVDEVTGKHSINVGARSQGLLEELEKAHIYIEQLHGALAQMSAVQAQLQARVERLEAR